MKRKLTDRQVNNLKPKDKAYKVADGVGLYLYITTTGAKSWRYDFKQNDKYKTVTYGQYPAVSLADARVKHDAQRERLAKGIDINVQSMRDKCFSFYAFELLKAQNLRAITHKQKLTLMREVLFPALDKKAITDVTALDLLNLLKPLAENGRTRAAKKAAVYCRQVFDYALGLQLITSNPAEGIGRLLPRAKQGGNYAHITDPTALFNLMVGIDGYRGDYAVKNALKFAPLALLRPYNIRFLKWEYVDMAERLITIPAKEMKMNKPHKLSLSAQALAILEDMQQLTRDYEYVFTTARGMANGTAMGDATLGQALARVINPVTGEMFGKHVQTLHGFRHTASTFLNEMGFNADAIELQLAHTPTGVRAIYNKAERLAERGVMMQAWADYLDSLKSNANVVPIKRRA